MKLRLRFVAMAGVVACWFAVPSASMAGNERYGDDDIYVGETSNDTIQRCDIGRGTCYAFVQPAAGGLHGPRGMIFRGNKLVVVNQNVNIDANGEVLRYEIRFDGRYADFKDKIVAGTDKNSPVAPRGIVRGPGNVYYVADIGLAAGCKSDGRIARYDSSSDTSLDDLDFTGYKDDQMALGRKPGFYPRGIVFGPDGYLYVTLFGCPIPNDPLYDPEAGYVARFDPRTGKYVNIVAPRKGEKSLLHRPEGILFDRRGNIWVTSFRQHASNLSEIDVLLKIDRKSGRQLDLIPLGLPEAVDRSHYRTSAQAIVIGPGGDIFAPITRGPTDLSTSSYPIQPKEGAIWRCSPHNRQCSVVVRAGRGLTQPWYAIFRDSDPATLEYNDD